MPRVMREADSSLEFFPARDVPAGKTVGEIRREFRHTLKLVDPATGNHLLALISNSTRTGEPVDDNYVLKEGDVLYFKVSSKGRGPFVKFIAR